MWVEQFLNEGASRFGSRAAIVADGRPHSYSDLARNSDRVGAALMARGVKHGERVAFFMDNTFAAVVSAFAVLKAGAVVGPIDPASDAEGLEQVLDQSRAVGIVTDARHASVAAVATARTYSIRFVLLCGGGRSTTSASCLSYEDLVGGIGFGRSVARAGAGSDVAVLLQPSLAELTHDDLIAAAADCASGKSTQSALSYSGFCQLLASVRVGATTILDAPSAFRSTVLDRSEAEMALVLNG